MDAHPVAIRPIPLRRGCPYGRTTGHSASYRRWHDYRTIVLAAPLTPTVLVSVPNVTVISPVHNAASFLDRTIESVQRQTLTDWEYILVDDGSTDRSAAIIDAYGAADSRIRLLRQAQQGACRARNRGAEASDPSARYLFFLDADDALEPEALQRMSAYLDAHPEVGLLGCQWTLVDEADQPLPRQRPRTRRAPGRLVPRRLRPDEKATPFVTFYCGSGQGPCALYRRSVFMATEGWDERLTGHQDSDMFIQMSLRAPVHYLPDRLYRYRRHDGNMTNDRRRMYDAQEVLRAKWDHYEAPTPKQQQMLTEARRYYYSIYHPTRSLFRAARCLVTGIRHRRSDEFRWARYHLQACLTSWRTFLRYERDAAPSPHALHPSSP